MRFYLFADWSGRIILDTLMHGRPIDALSAEPEYEGEAIYRSAWQVARDWIDEYPFERRVGHGYFVKGRGDVPG